MYAAKLNSVHMINLLVQQYRADLTVTDAVSVLYIMHGPHTALTNT